MSSIERLLEPGSTELPDCRCDREMAIDQIELVPDSEARVRIYQCQYCGSELRLTVWEKLAHAVGKKLAHDSEQARD